MQNAFYILIIILWCLAVFGPIKKLIKTPSKLLKLRSFWPTSFYPLVASIAVGYLVGRAVNGLFDPSMIVGYTTGLVSGVLFLFAKSSEK